MVLIRTLLGCACIVFINTGLGGGSFGKKSRKHSHFQQCRELQWCNTTALKPLSSTNPRSGGRSAGVRLKSFMEMRSERCSEV